MALLFFQSPVDKEKLFEIAERSVNLCDMSEEKLLIDGKSINQLYLIDTDLFSISLSIPFSELKTPSGLPQDYNSRKAEFTEIKSFLRQVLVKHGSFQLISSDIYPLYEQFIPIKSEMVIKLEELTFEGAMSLAFHTLLIVAE